MFDIPKVIDIHLLIPHVYFCVENVFKQNLIILRYTFFLIC